MTKKIGDAFAEAVLEKCEKLPDRPMTDLTYFAKALNTCRTKQEVLDMAGKKTVLKGLLRKEGFYDFDKTIKQFIKKYRL